MPTIKFPKNPNTDTAFVEQDDGTKNRALMIAPQDISTLELPNNPNSTKGYITVDGKKQRVILTADITGGGGGGAVSSVNGKTGAVVLTSADIGAIPQYSDMPEPNRSGDIVQYIGDTTPNYTNGFFYKSEEVSSYSAEQTVGQNVTEIVVDRNAFVNFLENHPGLSVPLTVTMTNVSEPETMSITYGDGTDLTATCVAATLSAKLVNTFINGYNDLNHADLVFARTQNDTWDVSGSFQRHSTTYPEPIQVSETNINLSDYGITIDSGTAKQGDTISVGVDGYWVGYDCDGVTGYLDFGIWYKGYFETGDVIVVSEGLGLGWNRIDVQTVGLVNTATAEYSLGILGSATQAYSVAAGDGAIADGMLSTVVGNSAYVNATGGTAVGSESGASGYMASAYGRNAVASGDGSIQLGEGVNSESYSFAVGCKINNTQKEYKLLDINSGLIPAERLANTFYATQGYVLTLDANGGAVWQAGGGVSSVNGKTGTVVLSAEDVSATPQYSTMPTADSTNVGEIVQFTGATDATYTNGYFYKGVSTTATTPATGTIDSTWPEGAVITINWDALLLAMQEILNLDNLVDVVNAFERNIEWGEENIYDQGTGVLELQSILVNGNTQSVNLDTAQYPNVFSTTAVDDDGEAIFVLTSLSGPQESTVYSWERINTQPGSEYPSQSGNAGKFLTTDGTDASWSNELSNEFNIVAPVSVTHWLGIKATNAPSCCYFRLSGSNIGNKYAGTTLYVGYPTTYGPYGGQSYFRFEYNYTNSSARVARFCAYGTGVDKTELGGPSDKWGTVYTTKINNGADITVPTTSGTMVVATPPSADGTYVLKATVSSGVVTVAWVAE